MTAKKPSEGEIIPTRPSTHWRGGSVRNLTPGRLAAILNSMDAGDITDAMNLFDEMDEKDLHLGAVMQTRVLAAISRERDITPASDSDGDRRIADFVKDALAAIPRFQTTLAAMMTAVSHGFAMSEIIWKIDDGAVLIEDVIPRPHRVFTFADYEDPARLLEFPRYISVENPNGQLLPREKFIFHKGHRVAGDCVKSGVYRGVSWYYLFTNFTIKDWLTFIDLYGIPLRLGKYRPTTEESARDTLRDAVANLGSDAAAVISDDTTIEFIQSAATGNQTLFLDAAEFFNRQKSKAILGQTLTTENTSGGAYSLGKVHDRVRQDIVAFDCMALDATVSHDLIRPLVDFNFGKQRRYPAMKTRMILADEADARLDQIRKIVELGGQVPARVIAEMTGVPLSGDLSQPLTLTTKGA